MRPSSQREMQLCFRSVALALLWAAALGPAGCEGQEQEGAGGRVPVLSLTQSGIRTVDLSIAGPGGLRALQARLVYDKGYLRLTKVAAGQEAARLDRVFYTDLKRANGNLVVGLSDTRKVRLPARGRLLRFSFEPVGNRAGQATTVRVEGALGVSEEAASGAAAARISLASTGVQVRVQ